MSRSIPQVFKGSATFPVAISFLAGTPATAADVVAVDFNLQVRPILSTNCFECHGPDSHSRKADLRLDLHEGLMSARGDGEFAVVPGNRHESLLWQRISADNPEDRMPPPGSRHALDQDEIELLGRWIQEGASWSPHWSYVPPRRSPLPQVKQDDWCLDSIDHHVLDQLEERGLTPADEADRETLLRRLSFDLTGLPPTIEEMDAFLARSEPGAYEQEVDRLLASPRFGEHMATAWLDLARYADTYGYQSDVARNVWPYRDWVIEAFNDNLPYDQFIAWQLAGDLLPDPTRNQQLATAFNRLHRQTNEGGSVEEEYRVEYVSYRVNTFATAVLGLTTECARCHDHKFDPISQEEYYQLSAFFDNIDESGLYSHFTTAVPTPSLLLTTPEQESQLEQRTKQVLAADSALQERVETAQDAFKDWLEQGEPVLHISGLQGDYPLDEIKDATVANMADPDTPGKVTDSPQPVPGIHAGIHDGALLLSGENNINFPGVGEFSRVDPFTISLWLKTPATLDRAVVIHRSRAWTDAGSQGYQLLIKDGRPSWSLIHFWPGNAISIEGTEPLALGTWTHVLVTHDGSATASGLAMYINGSRASTAIVRDNLYKPITGGGPGPLTIGQRFRDRGFKNGSVDAVKIYNRALTSIEAAHLFDGTSLEEAYEARSEDLLDYYLANHDEAWRSGMDSLHAARKELVTVEDGITEIMTMREMPAQRSTYFLERGSYEIPRQAVEPATPEHIMPFPATLPANRAGLAAWATDPTNPLTARVAVNRLWMTLFGEGLVPTPEDFGSQGIPPSHPKLLDMLALDFIESGWDVKAMLRRLVCSGTYRQQSRAEPGQRVQDPDNTQLARGASHRLTAEMIRDHALASSNLLVEQIGGPSVRPYQPPGLWKDKGAASYVQGTGEDLHRRSLYTYWKRTSPPPSMMMFDAVQRDICVARRPSTTTPLQALVLLNDPQYIEAARVLAERAISEGGDETTARITIAFRLLASRHPSKRELEVLIRLHDEQLSGFTANVEAASALASTGEATRQEGCDDVEVAAMTVVCSTILSSDAATMRR